MTGSAQDTILDSTLLWILCVEMSSSLWIISTWWRLQLHNKDKDPARSKKLPCFPLSLPQLRSSGPAVVLFPPAITLRTIVMPWEHMKGWDHDSPLGLSCYGAGRDPGRVSWIEPGSETCRYDLCCVYSSVQLCIIFSKGLSIIPLTANLGITDPEGADAACMAFPWLVCLGFSLTFSMLWVAILVDNIQFVKLIHNWSSQVDLNVCPLVRVCKDSSNKSNHAKCSEMQANEALRSWCERMDNSLSYSTNNTAQKSALILLTTHRLALRRLYQRPTLRCGEWSCF